jgi:hypothetical protein
LPRFGLIPIILTIPKRHRASKKDHKQLMDLIHKGKLFALQEWIKSSKPLQTPETNAGTDPNKDNVFARALCSIKARPLLGFYRQFRTEFPALDDQAALALSEAVNSSQVRWTALLACAGADLAHRSHSDSAFEIAPPPACRQ